MNVWKILCSLVVSVCYLPLVFAAAGGGNPAGTWTTIDETGAKRAIVKLTLSNGTLNGYIVKVFPKAGDTGMCNNCPGAFKGKPVQGLGFVWGLKDKGNGEWGGGSILDPKTGKVYSAKMTLQGNKLLVRGYVGISALGRTQTWVR